MINKVVLKTEQLSKKYKDFTSVDNLSIEVERGEIYGLLGPNGAGKSTTMKMVLGLVKPTEGKIQVFNKDLSTNKQLILKDIGCLIEEPSYYENLTGLENMRIMQKLLSLPDKNVEEALKIVRLNKHKDKIVKQYSLGMKQRLGIALAIIKFPKLLILDEPTNGLDPSGIQEIRELITSLPKKYGMTIIISSHLLSEIEQMATTVGILNKGKLLFQGKLNDLEEKPKIEFITNNDIKTKKILNDNRFLVNESSSVLVDVGNKEQISNAIKLLVDNDIKIYQVYSKRKSLEDIFLEMTFNSGGDL
uniref:LmgF-immunity to the lacticin LMG ABC transporter (ATP-binding domain) n=1 Tax=Lactococcus lactis subsp. lactis TaxID=1360 RepID=A0A0M7BEJ1_LACLL|nr:LmgF-immunity to the lacticin LMG; ABC transporter (ATP-binding domain) [Lactococcus lactis subsp. lactis]